MMKLKPEPRSHAAAKAAAITPSQIKHVAVMPLYLYELDISGSLNGRLHSGLGTIWPDYSPNYYVFRVLREGLYTIRANITPRAIWPVMIWIGFCGRSPYIKLERKRAMSSENISNAEAAGDLPANIQDMIEDFAFLEDWEDRYTHVIDMGKNLAPLDAAERNPATKVNGCVSQVWLVSEFENGLLVFRGDSDAHIVKGLVAVTLAIFSGRMPQDILALDAEAILKKLDLSEHLSPQRSNGLKAMIARIKSEAQRRA